MSPKGKKASANSGSPSGQAQNSFIMDDVKLLLKELTAPETGVNFSPPQRATTATIESAIRPPTWTWVNLAARTAQPVTQDDVGKVGIQADTNTLYQLTNAAPPIWQPVPNPANTSSPLELSTGAADAPSYHDFFRLQIAFEDVWKELLDQSVPQNGEQLYASWDALMDQGIDDTGGKVYGEGRWKRFAPVPLDEAGNPKDISGEDELTAFIHDLKVQLGLGNDVNSGTPSGVAHLSDILAEILQGCNMLLTELNRVGLGGGNFINGYSNWAGQDWLVDTDTTNSGAYKDELGGRFSGIERQYFFNTILQDLQALSAPAAQDILLQDLTNLLASVDAALKEKYRFDVFAPDSINYGLLLNYRQRWEPQSYQVGNLVSTIPLAPQETRRYTTKTIIKKTRNVKEIDDSLRSGKDESSVTWRVDSEIVERAKNQTNFQKNVSGSFGNDNLYKVSSGMQQGQDQAVESAQTKREFHESVVKSAQEYRNEHRLEITTEESREDESTSYREIRNPNDELTVTYLFYELQRRYLVNEELHKVTPVILVANDVPAPHEIDSAWILRYDWIIKRTILDDSFLPALNYLAANYVGENVTLEVLKLAVDQQKEVVDRISRQVQLANVALNAATLGLEKAETQEVEDLRQAEQISIVKSIFDPLGISGKSDNGNSDRARVDFAKDALNRAQTKVNELVSQLKGETTALQVAIDKYTKAATEHFSMLADIDRLRGHVKDNIIYYMQAIWTYEPADQRYFRLFNLDAPVFTHNTQVRVARAGGPAFLDPSNYTIRAAFPPPTPGPTMRLHQVADLETLIGFKGNYMIFPMVNFNYMTWFMMQDYLHFDRSGVTAQDPDPLAGLTITQMKDAMATVYAADPKSFEAETTLALNDGTTRTLTKRAIFEEIMLRLLSKRDPELVIVPSNSLYIEALPGTHPLLEDFKLIHRALDVKKVQAEARHAELENLRLAARLSKGERGDPDIDKVVVVGSGQNVTVDAG